MPEIFDGAAIGERLFGEALDPRELLVRAFPPLADVVPPLDHVVLTARPLVARVNHGQWIASCDCGAPLLPLVPTPGGVVFFDRPLVWCMRCRNGGTGRGWRPVQLPAAGLRDAIEAVLVLRPDVTARNWEPGETVAELVAENLAHGVPVPRVEAAPPADDPTRDQEPWPSAAARAVLAALKPRRRRPFGIGR